MSVRTDFIDIDEDLPFKGNAATDLRALILRAITNRDPLAAEIILALAGSGLPQRFRFGSAIDAPEMYVNGQPLSSALGNYLPTEGGTMQGDIAMAEGKTVDGVDVGAFKSDYDSHGHPASEISDLAAILAGYLLKSGGDLTGKVTTVASAAAAAGFNLKPGAAPTAPQNGDAWVVNTDLYFRMGNYTYRMARAIDLGAYLRNDSDQTLNGGLELKGGLNVVGKDSPEPVNAWTGAQNNPVGQQTATYYRIIGVDASGRRTMLSDSYVSAFNYPLSGSNYNYVDLPSDTSFTRFIVLASGSSNGPWQACHNGVFDAYGLWQFMDTGTRVAYTLPTRNETAVITGISTNTLMKLQAAGAAGATVQLDANMSFGQCLRVKYTAGTDVEIKVWNHPTARVAADNLLYHAGNPNPHQTGEIDGEPWGIFDVDANGGNGDLYVEIVRGANVTVDFVIVKMG